MANIDNSPNENSEIESSNNSNPVENTNNIVQTNESNGDNQSDLLRSESESSHIDGDEPQEEEQSFYQSHLLILVINFNMKYFIRWF
jgi:hypothetical protein